MIAEAQKEPNWERVEVYRRIDGTEKQVIEVRTDKYDNVRFVAVGMLARVNGFGQVEQVPVEVEIKAKSLADAFVVHTAAIMEMLKGLNKQIVVAQPGAAITPVKANGSRLIQ